MPEFLPADPGLWLYLQGETGYVSLAFGDWVREQPDGWWFSLSRALSVFHYDQRGRELIAEYGERTLGENTRTMTARGWWVSPAYMRKTHGWQV